MNLLQALTFALVLLALLVSVGALAVSIKITKTQAYTRRLRAEARRNAAETQRGTHTPEPVFACPETSLSATAPLHSETGAADDHPE